MKSELRRRLREILIMLVLLVAAYFGLDLQTPTAPVTGAYTAVDGDSLRKGGQDVRLHGIDAPELHQTCSRRNGQDYSCGQEAKRTLAGLITGKSIACAARDTDRYGRIVAVCRVDSLEINAEMARLGWAIAYKKHSGNYVREEAEARAARRGLWQGDFEAPDSWRSSNRSGIKQGALGGEAAWDED